MQSLPTPITTENLNHVLTTLCALPSAQVTRHADVVTVTATRKATGERVTVLRAVTRDGKYWHAMAAAGLITTKFST
jgi:hypothetical protein